MKYPGIMLQAAGLQWAMTHESMEAISALLQGEHDVPPREAFHASDIEASATVLGERPADTVLTRIRGSVGSLSINGPITPRASAFAESSGIVSIDRLIAEFKALETNAEVSEIMLILDSPGGAVTGVSEFASMVAGCDKRVTAYVFGMAASAAYWIASACDRIIASDTGMVGSIGVVSTFRITKDNDRSETVEIVSSQSPKKRADVTTDEGREQVQALLDEIANVFIETVAENRDVSRETVLEDFGQGAVFVAQRAREAGMIDGIGTLDEMMGAFETADSDEIFAAMEPQATATSFKDLPVVDKPWDADAAMGRVRTFTKSTEKPSGKYKGAFFWYDAAKSELFTSYKLPFADIVDGRMVAIRRGVFAANAAMQGARGGVKIPPGDRGAVQSHIDKYRAKIAKMDKKKTNASASVKSFDNPATPDIKLVDKSSTMAKEPKMNLKELVAKHPELAAEIESLKAAAQDDGIKAERERTKSAVKILQSSDYHESVKTLAAQVISGDAEPLALTAVIAAVDSMKADKETTAAADEASTVVDTAAGEGPVLSQDGHIRSLDDIEAEAKRLNQLRGLEV